LARNAVATSAATISQLSRKQCFNNRAYGTQMNEQDIRSALDSIARNYKPPRRERFASLIPFRNQIQDIRNQRASFETIAKFLKKFSIETTGETVRRFYRIVIEQKSAPQKRRRKVNCRAAKANLKSTKSWSIGEPRIARIKDL